MYFHCGVNGRKLNPSAREVRRHLRYAILVLVDRLKFLSELGFSLKSSALYLIKKTNSLLIYHLRLQLTVFHIRDGIEEVLIKR